MNRSRRQLIGMMLVVVLLLAIPVSWVIWQISRSYGVNHYWDQLSKQTAIASNGMSVIAEYDDRYTAVWGRNIGRLGDALSWDSRVVRQPRGLSDEDALTLYFPTGATFDVYPLDYETEGMPESAEVVYINYRYEDSSTWIRSEAGRRSTMAILLETVSPDGFAEPNLLLDEEPDRLMSEQEVATAIEASFCTWLDVHTNGAVEDGLTVLSYYDGRYTAVLSENIERLAVVMANGANLISRPSDLKPADELQLQYPSGASYTAYPVDYATADDPRTAQIVYIHYEYGENSLRVEFNGSVYRTFRQLVTAVSEDGYSAPNAVLEEKPSAPLTEAEAEALLSDVTSD